MARFFNGTADNVRAAISSDPASFSAVTLAGWAKIKTTAAGYQTVIASSASDTSGIWFHNTNFAYYGTAAGSHFLDPGSASATAGVWYHLAFSGAMSGTATAYVNGASDGTFSMPAA